MSAFGDGTREQDMYDWIKHAAGLHGLDKAQLIAVVLYVISYIANEE